MTCIMFSAEAPGMSCSCSSDYGTGFTCDKAYDGITTPHPTNGYGWYSYDGDVNAYVQINFPSATTIGRVTVYNGCWTMEQCSSIKFSFSDASEQTVNIYCKRVS